MVSLRCKIIVREELKGMGLIYTAIEFGIVTILKELVPDQHQKLKKSLAKHGLELMDDKRAMIIDQIEDTVIGMIHSVTKVPKIKYDIYISEKLGYDYPYIAEMFAEVKGITIETYIITNKIERVKELLLYSEMSFTEIANFMDYNNVIQLAKQFKATTGLKLDFFREVKEKKKTLTKKPK
jgi:YesN/AraC family two-component response regulator